MCFFFNLLIHICFVQRHQEPVAPVVVIPAVGENASLFAFHYHPGQIQTALATQVAALLTPPSLWPTWTAAASTSLSSTSSPTNSSSTSRHYFLPRAYPSLPAWLRRCVLERDHTHGRERALEFGFVVSGRNTLRVAVIAGGQLVGLAATPQTTCCGFCGFCGGAETDLDDPLEGGARVLLGVGVHRVADEPSHREGLQVEAGDDSGEAGLSACRS